jgi:hypothetical protein
MVVQTSSAPDFAYIRRRSGSNECPASLEAQPTSTSHSFQIPNVNSSSLYEIFKVVGKVFQQIMTDPSGTESEENGIAIITKMLLKPMKQTGCI